MKLDIFGKQEMEIVRCNGEWMAFYCGNEGKKRKVEISISSSLSKSEVVEYIDDLFHEWATQEKSSVKIVPNF